MGADKHYASNYEEGNLIHFRHDYQDLKAGETARIIKVNENNNVLTVRAGNKDIYLNPVECGHLISGFRESDREFAAGDRIMFLKKDNMFGLNNGQMGTIIKANSNGVLDFFGNCRPG